MPIIDQNNRAILSIERIRPTCTCRCCPWQTSMPPSPPLPLRSVGRPLDDLLFRFAAVFSTASSLYFALPCYCHWRYWPRSFILPRRLADPIFRSSRLSHLVCFLHQPCMDLGRPILATHTGIDASATNTTRNNNAHQIAQAAGQSSQRIGALPSESAA